MYAPKGVGALFVRRKLQLAPMFFGGSHERQRRAGTENVPGIVALGRAAELAMEWFSVRDKSIAGASSPGSGTWGSANPEQLAALRDHLEQGLLTAIPGSGINCTGEPRTPNTISLYCDSVDAEALVIALDLAGIAVSGGSACQSGATEPSHVLTAMHLSETRTRGASASPSPASTPPPRSSRLLPSSPPPSPASAGSPPHASHTKPACPDPQFIVRLRTGLEVGLVDRCSPLGVTALDIASKRQEGR